MKSSTAVPSLVLGLTALVGAVDIEGVYRNPEYGYSIEIPPGLKASTTPPPTPQHGFRISTSDSAESLIWVDGSYNTTEAKSAEEILRDTLKDIRTKATVESVSESKTRLGTMPAASISMRYRTGDSQTTMVREQIVALRRGTAQGVIYTIGMIVPLGRYDTQRTIFERLMNSFHISRLPR